MTITLTRREAALLGWMLRQLVQTAGDGVTGQNLPDLLRIWNIGFRDESPPLAALVQRVLALVAGWPVSLRTALIEERCRLRPLDNDFLSLELDREPLSGRATA